MTIEIVHTTIDRLHEMGAKVFSVELTLHDVSEQNAAAIVQHFPDLAWDGHRNGATDWLTGRTANLEIVLFLESDYAVRPEPIRALQILSAARA